MIRSPGRRPFNNKTRSHGSRSRPRPTTPRSPRVCARARVRKRINFSRAFMLSDRPNYTRGFHRRFHRSRNTHTLRNTATRTYENTYGLTARQATCRRKIITTEGNFKIHLCAKCAKGEPYNAMIKHGRGKGLDPTFQSHRPPDVLIFSLLPCYPCVVKIIQRHLSLPPNYSSSSSDREHVPLKFLDFGRSGGKKRGCLLRLKRWKRRYVFANVGAVLVGPRPL